MKIEKNPKNFTFFGDYLKNCETLPRKEQDQMIIAIVRYVLCGEQPIFKKKYLNAIFNCIKFSLDISISRSHPKENDDVSENPKNQNEIKMKSNENQTTIKAESNDNQTTTKTEASGNQITSKTKSNDNQIEMNKNKNKNIKENIKEKIKISKTYSSLSEIGEAEILFVARDYLTTPAFVRNCLDNLRNYCGSKGKRYKNYLAALRNFVKSDLDRGSKDPRKKYTNTLFSQAADNPDLTRQKQTIAQTKPASADEIAAARAAFKQRLIANLSEKGDGRD